MCRSTLFCAARLGHDWQQGSKKRYMYTILKRVWQQRSATVLTVCISSAPAVLLSGVHGSTFAAVLLAVAGPGHSFPLKGGSFPLYGTQMDRALKAMTGDSPVHTHPSCAAAAAPTPPAAAGANTGPRPVRAANWDPSTMTATEGMAAQAICTEAYLQAACRNTRHAGHDGNRVDDRFCWSCMSLLCLTGCESCAQTWRHSLQLLPTGTCM